MLLAFGVGDEAVRKKQWFFGWQQKCS